MTAVARKGAGQYAFYRGTTRVGAPPAPAAARPPARRRAGPAEKPPTSQSLDKNLKDPELDNQMRQIDRLQNRYRPAPGRQPVLTGL